MLAKMVGIMEWACEAFCREVHTEELLQKPWAMISWSWILSSNASVAPDHLNV